MKVLMIVKYTNGTRYVETFSTAMPESVVYEKLAKYNNHCTKSIDFSWSVDDDVTELKYTFNGIRLIRN